MLQILLSRLSVRGVDGVIGSNDVTYHFSNSRMEIFSSYSNSSRDVLVHIVKKYKREKQKKDAEKKRERERANMKKGTFIWTNGTEKTVDRSIVFQPIADVVKLELVADSNFIGRHWSVVEWRTLLGTPIRCDC